MGIINWLINFFSNNKSSETTPEGYCPNCWGRQEYEGKFIDALNNEKIDLNNLNEKKGWIQDYAVRQFEGIQLKKSKDYFECPTCKLEFKDSGK